jgi:hypothetical protein
METNKHPNESKAGFLKLMRSPETETLLLNDPLAFALLANVAMRARWRTKFDVRGLEFGEALMGDYQKIGFTRQQYRTRLKRLVEYGLVTTRPTRRGTVVTLASSDVFCLTSKENAKNQPTVLPLKTGACQPTVNQRLTNSQPLTNNDRRKEQKSDTSQATSNSIPTAPEKRKAELDFVFKGYQNQPVQNHVKWPEFAAWCRRKSGTPTDAGFWKWLCGQKPQWQNRVKKNFDGETGYVLDGKFYTDGEAIALGRAQPELLTKFRRATRRGSNIVLMETAK